MRKFFKKSKLLGNGLENDLEIGKNLILIIILLINIIMAIKNPLNPPDF